MPAKRYDNLAARGGTESRYDNEFRRQDKTQSKAEHVQHRRIDARPLLAITIGEILYCWEGEREGFKKSRVCGPWAVILGKGGVGLDRMESGWDSGNDTAEPMTGLKDVYGEQPKAEGGRGRVVGVIRGGSIELRKV